MKQLTISVIGCGNRSTIYSRLAGEMKDQYKLVAAADPNLLRANRIKEFSGNSDFKVFSTYDQLFECEKLSDMVIIGTQDQDHYVPCKKALEKGYDVLLEKPISPLLDEILELEELAIKLGRKLQVCYVLRYTPFYMKVKEILESGVIGEVVSINAIEGVLPWHQAHSFVRGKWNRAETSSPMIVAKCCHDTDIISWLLDDTCRSVSSYGALTHFVKENAPEGAPERCTDGCPHADKCYYNAERYATDMRDPWLELIYDNFETATEEEIIEWIKGTDFSRCVYRCDNNVVDHQIVNMEFESKTTANLTMTAFEQGRNIEIYGTKGTLKGGFSLKKITGKDILVETWDGEHFEHVLSNETTEDHHMGGDNGLMNNLYTNMVIKGESVSSYIQSHVIAYAAEESRVKDEKIVIESFKERFKK